MRRLPGEELVEDETQGVDVALLGDLLSRQLLGRHVGRRAGLDLGSLHLADQA